MGVIIFLNHRDRLFCNVFETPNNNNDYFTIITIIGPTINRSDASLKSTRGTQIFPPRSPKDVKRKRKNRGCIPALSLCSKWPPILEEDVQERNQKKGSLGRTGSLCLPVTYRVALLCSGKRGPSCFLGFIQTQRCF